MAMTLAIDPSPSSRRNAPPRKGAAFAGGAITLSAPLAPAVPQLPVEHAPDALNGRDRLKLVRGPDTRSWPRPRPSRSSDRPAHWRRRFQPLASLPWARGRDARREQLAHDQLRGNGLAVAGLDQEIDHYRVDRAGIVGRARLRGKVGLGVSTYYSGCVTKACWCQ